MAVAKRQQRLPLAATNGLDGCGDEVNAAMVNHEDHDGGGGGGGGKATIAERSPRRAAAPPARAAAASRRRRASGGSRPGATSHSTAPPKPEPLECAEHVEAVSAPTAPMVQELKSLQLALGKNYS